MAALDTQEPAGTQLYRMLMVSVTNTAPSRIEVADALEISEQTEI